MPEYPYDDLISVLRKLPPDIKRGKHSIPFIPKQEIDLKNLNDGLFLQGFQNCTSQDKDCKNKIVHFYIYDKLLEPLYQNPLRYIPKLGKYYAVRTPDYSRFTDSDEYEILSATYKNRFLGALWSEYGINVIPTIGWAGKSSFEICFEGVEQGSVVSISTIGVHNDQECVQDFLTGYDARRNTINPSSIICLGDMVKGRDTENVYFIPYKDSFGRQFKEGWQSKLF